MFLVAARAIIEFFIGNTVPLALINIKSIGGRVVRVLYIPVYFKRLFMKRNVGEIILAIRHEINFIPICIVLKNENDPSKSKK